jgi:ATP-dependent helicase HrpB
VAESQGKQYPVDVIYSGGQDERLLPEMTARTVIKAINENPGDALVFLPGEGEIRKCAELLKHDLTDFAIHPLYGVLPQSEQYRAIMPNKNGKRKIVLATSIAETSLTIEGIKIVVDTGFRKDLPLRSKIRFIEIGNSADFKRLSRSKSWPCRVV